MLTCDGNENSKKKKQQQHLWSANLAFRLLGHGVGEGDTQQSVKLGDSALIFQFITL